jgi:8-oxo-dGTP pyrophosphatase MutT (NUDIX family)
MGRHDSRPHAYQELLEDPGRMSDQRAITETDMFKRRVAQAGAVIWRSVGARPEILLVEAKSQPNTWIFPKGHLEPGEHYEAAALREAREEAGVVGRVVGAICPPLDFISGTERVRVQYYLLRAISEEPAHEPRRKQWLETATALKTLAHADARRVLREALPQIYEEISLSAARTTGGSPHADKQAFAELLLAEYQHIAESLLRNEEDGEKRVTFFMTLAGAAGTALAFLLGEDADVRPDVVHPLVVSVLIIVLTVGYFTIARVVTRNLTSDRFKSSLNRIRRHFLDGPDDPRVAFLAFDPFKREMRPRPRWTSVGRGGWLETVVLVESVVFGALVAMLVPTSTWPRDGMLAAAAALIAWVLLLGEANRRYDMRTSRPC